MWAQTDAAGGGWWQLLQNSSLIFWGCIALICIVPSIAHYWYKARRAEIDARLKQSMINQGMSVDEIERVLAARSGKRSEAPTADQHAH